MENNTKSNVPVTKAWQQMKELLDTEMPVAKKHNNKRKLSILALLLLIGSCGVYRFYNNNAANIAVVVSKNDIEISKEKNVMSNKIKEKNTTAIATNKIKDIEVNLINKTTNTVDKINNNNKQNFATKTNEEIRKDITITKYKLQKNVAALNNYKKINFTKNIALTKSNTNKTNKEIAVTENLKLNTATTKKVNSVNNEITKFEENITTASIKNDNTKDLENIKNKEEKNSIKKVEAVVAIVEKLPIKVPTQKKKLNLHYGLEWLLPLSFNNATLADANAKTQPLNLFIPAVWISKNITKKSSLTLIFNPNSQYLINHSAAFKTNNYAVSSTTASNSQQLNTVTLNQSFALDKIIGTELALQYNYQLSKKWSLGIAFANTWVNAALFNDKIIKDAKEVIKDNVYGVFKNDKDWQYINTTFVSGKLNVDYSLNRFKIGVRIIKPLSQVFEKSIQQNTPINGQLYLNWKLK